MRFPRIKNKSGSVIVLTIVSIPLLVTMLLLVIEAGRIFVARARLEAAVDRSAYVGAAVMVDGLNQIAKENWNIHKAWQDLSEEFEGGSQQNEETAKKRIKVYENAYDTASSNIASIRDQISGRARAFALEMLNANAPLTIGKTVLRGDISISSDLDPNQKGKTSYGSIDGTIFMDPSDVNQGKYEGVKYLIKSKGPDAAIGVFASQKILPILFKNLLPEGVGIQASAVAQAFGGSIEEFARKETDLGSEYLYRAALVPMWTIGAAGQGMRH